MVNIKTEQLSEWTSNFGHAYTNRWNVPLAEINKKTKHIFGISTRQLFKEMLSNLEISSVLEVGCNAGRKLETISKLGNYQLYGIDPQLYALKQARKRLPKINFIEGTAFDLPFKDEFFDLVFTYEVLIHIAPRDLPKAIAEIYRVSRRYILGMEYYTNKLEKKNYRGHNNLLWKQDFEKLYVSQFPNLKRIKSKLLDWNESIYAVSGLQSKIFLLEKY